MERTFTLRNGSEVFRSYSTGGDRLHVIPNDSEYLSDVEVKAIHKMANRIQRNNSLGSIMNDELCLLVSAPGRFIPESWIVG